jgi:ADP-ribose pyrophosphatase YjhB (NUDIX family)
MTLKTTKQPLPDKMVREMKQHMDGNVIVVTEYIDNRQTNQYRYPPKAGVIILNPTESHVLVCQNGYTYKEQNQRELWGLPKGHVEAGETLVDTAMREFAEETTLDELALALQPLCTGTNAVRHINSVYFVFRMTANTYQSYKNLKDLKTDGEVLRVDWLPIRKIIGKDRVYETNKETFLVLNESIRRLSALARDI